MANLQLNSPYKGSASLTREQFLFYEMRTTAKLIEEGLNDTEIMKRFLMKTYSIIQQKND